MVRINCKNIRYFLSICIGTIYILFMSISKVSAFPNQIFPNIIKRFGSYCSFLVGIKNKQKLKFYHSFYSDIMKRKSGLSTVLLLE